jgi:hypothetical protein
MTLMYRVRVATSGWTGGPGLSTFYFQGSTDPTAADDSGAQACVDRVQVGIAGVLGLFPTVHTWAIEAVVDVLTASTGALTASYAVDPGTDQNGVNALGYGPTAAMICSSLITSSIVAGKRLRGRTFWGPPCTGGDGNGTPSATAVAACQAATEALMTHGAGEPDLVVWHRPVSGAGGSTGVVESVFTRDKFAVLRSRRD